MKHLEKIIGIGMLVCAIGFNLWTYRLEPSALVDPNDNTFQYALVHRTNQIWDFAQQKCSEKYGAWNLVLGAFCKVSYLVDHWVPNWAQGYNLPFYYSHIPQILIVAGYRLFSFFGSGVTLFQFYHFTTYLLLSIFPLPLFLSLRIIGLSPISAGFGALIATHLSTDGLYGLDPSSFLWRGYGLSSQLYAMMFLPLAIAFSFRGRVLPAIFTLTATTAGHLGIGIIGFISVFISHLSHVRFLSVIKKITKNLLIIYGGALLLLGYWILPILLYGDYHNTSVWDPIWKFDSYGFRVILTNFFNGDLFDFGRLPILTALVFVGLFSCLSFRPPSRNPVLRGSKWTPDQVRGDNIPQLACFGILFLFWLLFYFGTTTWGSLLYLIPGMRDFHLSRFIVGVHMTGLLLIPLGIEWIVTHLSSLPIFSRISKSVTLLFCYFVVFVVLVTLVYPQTLSYSSYNDELILRANNNYIKQQNDVSTLLSTLSSLLSDRPGRVFSGRGGGWGKKLMVAETPYYMHLSTYGIPTVLWLPETWSPNSDTEQYFREDKPEDYALYNIRYVVAPPDQNPQPFWTLKEKTDVWSLYTVSTRQGIIASGQNVDTLTPSDAADASDAFPWGYITTGVRPAIVSSSKDNFLNVVRLWIQSDFPKNGLYPELTFDPSYPKTTGLPNFRMLDEVTYKVPDGSRHALFAENPIYIAPEASSAAISVLEQSQESGMVYKARVSVPESCTECLVILKQTYHPSWRVTVDGTPVKSFAVFPFFTAIKVSEQGTHEVQFSYEPSPVKVILLVIGLISFGTFCWVSRPKRNT